MTEREALRLALEALEKSIDNHPANTQHKNAITTLRQAIAEAEKHKCAYPHCSYPCPDLPDCIDAKKQEPVAWWNDIGTHIDLNVSGRGKPLYTHPPKREWVGLTDEEIQEIALEVPMDAVRITEAKLKEKNHV